MSKRPNERSERLKRRFLEYRKYARQLSEKSLDREIAALERFDGWNGARILPGFTLTVMLPSFGNFFGFFIRSVVWRRFVTTCSLSLDFGTRINTLIMPRGMPSGRAILLKPSSHSFQGVNS
jgi:hypothetical protein